MPVHYEVSVVPDEHLRAAFASYMRAKHVREVLDTGCFVEARFAVAEGGKFRTTYVASSPEELERYLGQHAARLRADFADHFPNGVVVTREIWEVVEEWTATSP